MKLRTTALALCLFILAGVNFANGQQYAKPALSDPGSYTMIVIPDPQTYVKLGRNTGTLELITAWIAENVEPLNIQAVLVTGDIVEHNELYALNPAKVDRTSTQQWEASSRAFERLDGKVPYILCTGNHDYTIGGGRKGNSQLHDYFPPERNLPTFDKLRYITRNTEGRLTLENAVYELTTPDGKDYFIMSLEFAPRDTILDWAAEIAAKPQYKNHRGIILTHAYLHHNNNRIQKNSYDIEDANYGVGIWDKVVYPNSNIELVVCGHVASPHDFTKHVGFRTDPNSAGKTVNQMLFNAQALGGGWHGNGGEGWIRILEFLPDGKTVAVKTFSPLFAISPQTNHLAYETSDYNEFTMEFD